MEKMMVMVNSKYMVAVEAESLSSGEHMILDGIYSGIQTALAFSEKEMGTSYFVSCLMRCETISYAELENIAHDYACTLKSAEEAYAEISEIDREIERLMQKKAEKTAYIEAVRKTNRELIEKLGMRKDLGLGYAEV